MTQSDPRSKDFYADLSKSLQKLPREPIVEYLSSETEDGHHPCEDFLDTTFLILYAADYYGYINLAEMRSHSSSSTKDVYDILCIDILKTLNEQLAILRAEFNTLKLIDSNGTLHTKFERLLVTLIADIKQDISSDIDKTSTIAGNQSVDGFSFISTSNNVYIEGVEEPIESQTMQWRFSLEKNSDGYSRYNLKAGEGYILKQFFGDAQNEIMLADIPLTLTEYDDKEMIFTGLPVKTECNDSQVIDFRNMKLIAYIDGGIVTKCRLYSSADKFCDYMR